MIGYVYAIGALGWALYTVRVLHRDPALAGKYAVPAWVVAAFVSVAIWPIMVCWAAGYALLKIAKGQV